MKIQEVSNICGISKNTIRYYEKNGLLSPKRNTDESREYNLKDIIKIMRHRKYLVSSNSFEQAFLIRDKNLPEKILELQNVEKSIQSEIDRLKVCQEYLKNRLDEAIQMQNSLFLTFASYSNIDLLYMPLEENSTRLKVSKKNIAVFQASEQVLDFGYLFFQAKKVPAFILNRKYANNFAKKMNSDSFHFSKTLSQFIKIPALEDVDPYMNQLIEKITGNCAIDSSLPCLATMLFIEKNFIYYRLTIPIV